jgi:LSD1 subclass zinc finger protein
MDSMSFRPLTADDLRWLVCPVCRQPLQLQADAVRCTGCARQFPIVDGIPVLLAERAV